MTARKGKRKHRKDPGSWMAKAMSALMAPARKRKGKPGKTGTGDP